MTDEELLGLIRQYEMASLGSEVAAGATISTTVYPSNAAMTTLEIDRYNALNAYLGRPLGNEIENRSQVVLPVVRDTVSWIMPQLMRIFAGSKSICRFDPENPQDEQQAEMETAVVNHMFMARNDGLLILHDLFWDALLLRNGYAEVETLERKIVREEKYTGLTEIELAEIVQDTADEKLDILEQREYLRDLMLPVPQGPPQLASEPAPPVPQVVAKVPVWDIRIRRTQIEKPVKVTCLPPEEMRVTPRAREGMENIAFSMHMTTMTRSDLIADGHNREWVNSLAAGRPNWLEIDALARNQVVDQLSIENPSDFAMQEIEVRKVVMQVDYDGDGVAELRRILVAGDKVGENEVIEETPFISCAPMRMPHRHTGISIYDLVMDLQIIQTTLWRAGLDNLTIANNLRVAVDWRNVNMDDLLTSRPHGPIRGNGPPSQWIQPLEMPSNITEQILPTLAYIDQLRSNRTGIGKGTMGLDADELQNVTKGGQLASMSAAALIVELIARLLAEGVKWIFLKIHSELIRHQDKPLELEISGKWVQVDPSTWRRRTRVTPNVGLGSGNREEMRMNVQLLAQAQQALAQMGLVGPKQAYESFKTLCEALGFSNPERFAMDPASQEFQQHMAQMQAMQHAMPNPAVEVAQIRAQSDQAKQQSEDQRKILDLQGDLIMQRIQTQEEGLKARQQMYHEALQNDAQRGQDRAMDRDQLMLELLKLLAPIVAAQVKGDENVDAGQKLAQETQSAESQLHERIAGSLDNLTQMLQGASGPRTVTLSDGRKIQIQ